MKFLKTLPRAAVFMLVGLTVLVSNAAPADTPEATVRNLLQSIQQMHHKKPLAPEQQQHNETISRQALVHLDVPQVSRETLGKYWEKRNSKEQEAFVQLLGDLFRYVAFPNSSKFFGELDIRYAATRTEGGQATVPLVVKHPEEGEVGIDFVLEQQSAQWRVVDVVLDGVSMRNNLRTQFHKVIRKHDYAELIRRMQKKLDKARN